MSAGLILLYSTLTGEEAVDLVTVVHRSGGATSLYTGLHSVDGVPVTRKRGDALLFTLEIRLM